LHKARGDRQAQSGAAEAARGRIIALLEGQEDLVLLVGGDTDAGVPYREMQNSEFGIRNEEN
jgi:hypothetical protein